MQPVSYARQRRRDRNAAVRLMPKLLTKLGFGPTTLVTDKLRSYGAAFRNLGLAARHEQSLRKDNRAENSREDRDRHRGGHPSHMPDEHLPSMRKPDIAGAQSIPAPLGRSSTGQPPCAPDADGAALPVRRNRVQAAEIHRTLTC